jgi:crotonobetainyl-CoA:carnitine CoA-transferase CaiB-like acyl-CoA transferase
MDQEESGVSAPLSGIRILAIEQFAAGPYGSMFLADLGAEIIKIENPATGGDPSRYTGPHMLGETDSEYFQSWNAGKRSIELDIQSEQGRRAFERLVKTADAVTNNLRGDLAEKLRLDYAALGQLNPAIVCLHISAYGRNNQRKSWPGYDYLMQAESGLMSVTGEPDGPPCRFGPSVVDYMTGMTGVVGLLASLLRAKQTSQGCDVDTCLFDVALHQLSYTATWYLNSGDVTNRLARSAHFSLAPVQTFPTADGWIFVMCMTDKFWINLVRALDAPHLEQDGRFCSPAARRENRAELTQVLDPIFRTQTTSAWIARLSGLLPLGPVHTIAEALDHPFVAETGMIRTVEHPNNPGLRMLSNPLKIDGVRPSSPVCAPLGADTAELVSALDQVQDQTQDQVLRRGR